MPGEPQTAVAGDEVDEQSVASMCHETIAGLGVNTRDGRKWDWSLFWAEVPLGYACCCLYMRTLDTIIVCRASTQCSATALQDLLRCIGRCHDIQLQNNMTEADVKSFNLRLSTLLFWYSLAHILSSLLAQSNIHFS